MKKRLAFLLIALLALMLAASAEVYCPYFDAHGDHNWQQIGFTYPTCIEPGYVYLRCADCGTEDTIVNPPGGHNWELLSSQDSTCTSNGWQKEQCTECDLIRTVELPLADHKYSSWMVLTEASDSKAGVRARTCQVCGTQEQETFYPDGTLYRGGPNGQAVKDLQQMLIDLGFLRDRADGSFGKKTEQAVRDYQAHAGLEATGVAFPQTIHVLGVEWDAAREMEMENQGGTEAPGNGENAGGLQRPEVSGDTCQAWRDENGVLHYHFCETHARVLLNELDGYDSDRPGDESEAILRAAAQLWRQAADALYARWAEQTGDAAQAARDAFFSALDLHLQALAGVYGADSPALTFEELSLLHRQCVRLCGLLNGE